MPSIENDNKMTQATIPERKIKSRLPDEKLILLHNWYKQNSHIEINYATKQLLSGQIKLTVKQITDWLYNEKRKTKKEDATINRITFTQRMILKNHFIYISTRPDVNELATKTDLTEIKIIARFTKQ